ncbi:MAG: biotin--[acetyl-CoA-carboxylase] ligase [Bacteroidia bacterium]|nr:biotin--[acetyl-CoA-carboxylase] ligase [Bacteroidia bacterium]MBT8268091.1 biotin--[acetyl-CoA-carboxylase] ligase [Bacteroidia bacterium]NNF83262.1 biotin--[acetyl-CoA-carboxylase] ligase [Flavobacteriaceae bacterium]NNK71045.1 biotin--[acetyl-CoA-carboxylase] ligase [Flavobacteriaceae bacterium]NNL79262.1 biotin--[acetyl-CoA-carboxylase] ligase [Flavobacteriaceae bacterium]
MHLIKLNAIGSTNSYLRQLCTQKVLKDFTVVMARHQTDGRGQRGTNWNSQKGKNLTCSVYKVIQDVNPDQSFTISMVTSLAIVRTLQRFNIPKLQVKWPNDILSEDKKICGILIENLIKNGRLDASIIGIGVNVNQVIFSKLPKASSLKVITGQVYDQDELLKFVIDDLRSSFEMLFSEGASSIKTSYENLIFRKDKPSTFKDTEGNLFPGYIQGVSDYGRLQVLTEDDILREFDLKEIELLY